MKFLVLGMERTCQVRIGGLPTNAEASALAKRPAGKHGVENVSVFK